MGPTANVTTNNFDLLAVAVTITSIQQMTIVTVQENTFESSLTPLTQLELQ